MKVTKVHAAAEQEMTEFRKLRPCAHNCRLDAGRVAATKINAKSSIHGVMSIYDVITVFLAKWLVSRVSMGIKMYW